MLNRTLMIAVATSAVVLAGCSGTPTITQVPPKANSSSEASTERNSEPSTESASEPLDSEQCLEVAEAHLDIIVASTAEEATPPAETLRGYDPPASVVEAIDHFVEVGGIQFDDPDATAYTDELKSWVAEVCPS